MDIELGRIEKCAFYRSPLHQSDGELVQQLEKRAAHGDSKAQQILASKHHKGGSGVPIDLQQAAAMYHLLADQGHAAAQRCLGEMFYFGEAVRQSFYKAAEWFELAADQGDSLSTRNLAGMYMAGLRVQVDIAKATDMFRRVAQQGDVIAQFLLLELGVEASQDHIKAVEICRLAADADYPGALGTCRETTWKRILSSSSHGHGNH